MENLRSHISGEVLIVRVGMKMFVITGEETNREPAESSASEEERAPRMRAVAGRAGGNRLGGEATAAQRGCAPGPGSHTELRAAGRALTSMSE